MSEWKEYRIKDLAHYTGSGTTPKSTDDRYYSENGHSWINTGDLNNDLVTSSKFCITDVALKENPTLRFYPKGTIVEAMYGATIGKVGLLNMESTVNQACCAIVPKTKLVNPKYLLSYLVSYKDKLVGESYGSTQPNVNQDKVRCIPIVLPSIAEQSRLVTYLDTKTSAIDSRISLLEQKCEAYDRLKKSIINDVITRGLNPNGKMKDSGVEYLGMIPETWKLLRFKELFKRYTTGVTPPSKDNTMFEMSEDAGYTWVTIADMTEKHVSSGKLRLSEKAKKQYNPVLTRKGSLLFSFKLTIGKVCFAEDDFYTNEAIISIPPTKKCSLDYMYHILPRLLQKNATENVYGAPMLNQKIIANLVIPIPPIEEQMAISEYINSKCAKIDSAISILNAQIEKYKLLKRSLINEVITGQRKV